MLGGGSEVASIGGVSGGVASWIVAGCGAVSTGAGAIGSGGVGSEGRGAGGAGEAGEFAVGSTGGVTADGSAGEDASSAIV